MPIFHQSTDSIQTSADGVDFAADNETLIIDPGVLVQSAAGYWGVNDLGYANSMLINAGFIDANGFYAVGLASENARLVNNAGAEILGNDTAVAMGGINLSAGSLLVVNYGDIIGANGDGIFFDFWAQGSLIVKNHGYIRAGYNTVDIQSYDTDATVSNFGIILGNNDAVDVNTAPGRLTVTYNAAGALLEAGANAIEVDSGILHFKNYGAVLGDVSVQDAEDAVIINHGQIFGNVYLGLNGGNDLFNGTGGTSEAIYGGGGNDRIIAGKGNVEIHVGGGNDLITGGPGGDRFIFDSALAGQIETITNFHPRGVHPVHGGKVDKIVLSETHFPGIVPGPNGQTLSQGEFYVDIAPKNGLTKIVYDSGNGFLYFSPFNESGLPQQHIHFATISPHLALTYGDFLVEA
jgi:hypothetical protein